MIIQKIRNYSYLMVVLTMLISTGCEQNQNFATQPIDPSVQTVSNLEKGTQTSKKSDDSEVTKGGKENKDTKNSKDSKEGKATKENIKIIEKPTLASAEESTSKSVYKKAAVKVETKKFDDKMLSWYIIKNKENKTPSIRQNASKMLNETKGVYIGNTSKKEIYLTFDCGYENGYTTSILDTLKNKNVKSSFFITGDYYLDNKKLVRRMIKDGHIIGNHTMNHPDITEISEDKLTLEVDGLTKQFNKEMGLKMTYFRPPSGNYSEKSLHHISNMGYKTIFWSSAYLDYDVKLQKGTTFAYNSIMNNLHNGAIFLLHTVSRDNAEALPMVIDDIRAKGYTIVNLDF